MGSSNTKEDNSKVNMPYYYIMLYYIKSYYYIIFVGMFFFLPCMDQMMVVDLRTVTFDVPPQEVSEHLGVVRH